MSKFRGYAQENRDGFDPIKAPDTSRRILDQAEQTIRGLQAVRDADVANTAAYLQSFNQAQEAERQSLSNYGRLMNLNFEARKTNLENQAKAAADRKRLAGENREAIYKNLAEFSKSAASAFLAFRQQKYTADYDQELMRLETQDVADNEDAQKYLADLWDSKNLDIIGVGIQSEAAAAEAAGADSFKVAQIRQRDAGISNGAKAARLEYYGSQYGTFLLKAITSDSETKVKIMNPDGSLRDGVPTDATDSKNVAFVSKQLMVGYLKQNGMYGMKPSFLVPALRKMREGADRIVAQKMQNEIAGGLQQQVDDIGAKFQSAPSAQGFHEAFARLQFMVGGPSQARAHLFALLETPQQLVEGAVVGFSDVQRSEIFQSSFPDQPNKTIAERYPQEVLKVKQEVQRRQSNRATAENTAEKLAIEQDLKNHTQTLVQDVTEGDNQIDLSDENIDAIQAEYRKLGPAYNKHIELYESFRQFTPEAVDAKPQIERYEEAIKYGMATPEEIMLNTAIPYDKRVELAKQAQVTDSTKPSETQASNAEAHITSYLRDRAKANGSKTIHRSLRVMTQYGVEQFRSDYIDARKDGYKPQQAYTQAIAAFNEEFDKKQDGEYAIDNDYTSKGFTSGRFKKFELYQGSTSTPEVTAFQIRDALEKDPNAISSPLVDIDPLKKVARQLKNGQKPAKVPQVEMIQRLAKKPGGGTYSYSEVLLSQMEAHGLKDTDRIQAAIQAENQIPARYQILRNYPSPVNTDVMLMSSGVPPVYTKAPESHTNALIQAAGELGVNPLDLAAIIGFESAGTYSPSVMGGAGGVYRGLIQFSPENQRTYNVTPNMTFEEQLLGPVVQYFKDRFAKVGMSTEGATLLQLYTTVLAGNPKANVNAKDSFGTSSKSGVARMQSHRDAALYRFFGGNERNILQPQSFGSSTWQQGQNMNPNLVERLTQIN